MEQFIVWEIGFMVVLYQEFIDFGLFVGSGESGVCKFCFNGQIINGVILNLVLQGIVGLLQKIGGLFVELVYVFLFDVDEFLLLCVFKGSVFIGSSLDVRINGMVFVIDFRIGCFQIIGDIKVIMLFDVIGYLSFNFYMDDLNVLWYVKLFMDVFMNIEEVQFNVVLFQNLLGVELSGIVIVQDGVLIIDVIGVVEFELFGQEYIDFIIVF